MGSTLDAFLADVEAFLERHRMEPTRFGVDALKDPKFVFDLREGRAPRLPTVDRVRAFMDAYRPADAPHEAAE